MRRVQAVITAQPEGASGYREFPVARVETYAVSSALDSDADAFSGDIGDPDHELNFLLQRDNEVRVTLLTYDDAVRGSQVEILKTGIADEVNFEEDVLSIQGRDLSSVPTDTDAEPGEWRRIRPDVLIKERAKKLGLTRVRAPEMREFNRIYTDGTESEWEFWYRMARKRNCWIWFEPDGELIIDELNYAESPTYLFGTPPLGSTQPSKWIPLTSLAMRKSTRSRIWKVWIFGADKRGTGYLVERIDHRIDDWKRRPIRVRSAIDTDTKADAEKDAADEIFDSQVGAIEIVLAIRDSGQLIRQNNMAEINVPSLRFKGVFFVVGVDVQGSPEDGFTQIVRLREKGFALSRKVPEDPVIEDPADTPQGGAPGRILREYGIRWANSFASAAQEFHDGWDYGLFLTVLLAICHKESGFRNVREGNSDIEWYSRPDDNSDTPYGIGKQDLWRRQFANSAGNPLNPFGREAGVGPMQLTTPDYKVWADGYGGRQDEYEGGRWAPQANIRAGARAFASKLSGLDPHKAENIWIGVVRYNGSGPAAEAYMRDVKRIWEANYKGIMGALSEAPTIAPGSDAQTYHVRDANGNPFAVVVPGTAPLIVRRAINYGVRQLGKPYAWGASGPNSFDCSGLYYAMYEYGNRRPWARVATYGYFRDGTYFETRPPKDSLLIGDGVFFNGLEHMGIYVGAGHFIHAPHTGDVVKISPLNADFYRRTYEGARRVVSWNTTPMPGD
jgi:prophage tail gpP-like protein